MGGPLTLRQISTTASLGVAWLAVVLSACQPAAPGVPTQAPPSAANPAQVLPAHTAISIATQTETAEIIADTLDLHAVEMDGAQLLIILDIPAEAGFLHLDLYDSQGQLRGRQLLASPAAGQQEMRLPYAFSRPQQALLVASQQDSLGRTTRLTSLALALPSQGAADLQAANTLDLQEVSETLTGSWLLRGQFNGPVNAGTVQIQLLAEDKTILTSLDRYLAEDGSFAFEIPSYTPAQDGVFLLTVSKQVQGVLIALDSAELRLRP